MNVLKKYRSAIILLIGISFIVAGIIRDEHLIVLKKAISIWLECIGLG